MKRIVVLLCILYQATTAHAQAPTYPWKTLGYDSTYIPGQLQLKGNLAVPGGKIKIGTGSNATSAALQVNDTAKGILIPRMTAGQMAAISSPATGLMIYNTSVNAFHFYNGSAWIEIGNGSGGSLPSLPSNRVIYTGSDSTLTTDSAMVVTDSSIYFSRTVDGIKTALALGRLSDAYGLAASGLYMTDGGSFTGSLCVNAEPVGGERFTMLISNSPTGIGGATGSYFTIGRYSGLGIGFTDSTENYSSDLGFVGDALQLGLTYPSGQRALTMDSNYLIYNSNEGRIITFPSNRSDVDANSYYPYGYGPGNNNTVLAFNNSPQATWFLNYDPNFIGSCIVDTGYNADGTVSFAESNRRTLCINGERFSEYTKGNGAGGANVFLGTETSFPNNNGLHEFWNTASYNTFVGSSIRPDSCGSCVIIGNHLGDSIPFTLNTVAIGNNAIANHSNSIAIGQGAVTTKEQQFVVGVGVTDWKVNNLEYKMPSVLADSGAVLTDVGGGKLEWKKPECEREYKYFLALLTQTGTDTPVIQVLHNEILNMDEWRMTRPAVGRFFFYTTGTPSLIDGRTVVTIGGVQQNPGTISSAQYTDETEIDIQTFRYGVGGLDYLDGELRYTPLEIRVY